MPVTDATTFTIISAIPLRPCSSLIREWSNSILPVSATIPIQSKKANILFAKELADQMRDQGKAVTAVCVHPGVIGTNLSR